MEKQRLDIALVEQGLAESREKAKALIMAGIVYIDEQKADKAGQSVPEGAHLQVRGKGMPYVSRGGYKLEKAISAFELQLAEKVCMDIGASTGGFTDCMLQNGAKKVYAVDVGYGQLAWKLRTDSRVVNLERTNIRYLEGIQERMDFISIDVSFISLKLVFPVVDRYLSQTGEVTALVKPQFEAGREQVGKKGVVRDPKVHEMVLEQAYQYGLENHLIPVGLSFSPIKGPEGNIEYLLYLKRDGVPFAPEQIQIVVGQSHKELK